MVTTAQFRHGLGVDLADSPPPYAPDSGDDPGRELSRPARLTIAAVIGLTLIGLAVTAIGVIIRSGGEEHTIDALPAAPAVFVDDSMRPPVPASSIIIHVVGQVNRPGIVELSEGARVVDAIESAGGVTPAAQVDALNLARILVDGEQVYVPHLDEEVVPVPGSSAASTTGPISLSRADQATLETLPGVGPALAGRIIDWRTQNGPFRSVSDLLAVSGIGPATLERFSHLVIP
jgi:competence protein ComEA